MHGTGNLRQRVIGWLLLPATLLAPPLAIGQPVEADTAQAAFDARFEATMREGGLVGAGAAILVGPRVRWMQGYGDADREQGVPFTPDTVMNIGSISKTITGVALMQAVERGLLDLDQDINAYLPFRVENPHVPGARITLRHLATHTSGLTDRWQAYAHTYTYGRDPELALGDFLAGYLLPGGRDYAADNFLPHAPGSYREYSNIGAALAGFIVERATGQSLEAWTQQQVFAPLGMDHSAWRLAQVPRHARLYVEQDGLASPILPYGLVTYPDGGVRTSVADLSRLFSALLDGGALAGAGEGARILSPAATADMLQLQYGRAFTPANVDPATKNSGIFWATKLDGTLVGHGGSDPGVRTEMLYDPKAGIGVILFTNTSSGADGMKAYASLLQQLRERALALQASTRTPSGGKAE